MTIVGPSTKEQIVRAAERLFAERGIDGVALRQIGVEAGSANKSAVQYHFGSKDALVRAIYEYRLPGFHERLDFLVAERTPDSLRAWVECFVRVALEQSELRDSYYMSFVAMLHQYGRGDLFALLPDDVQAATRTLYERVASFLTHLPEPMRTYRISQALVLIIHASSDRERASRRGRPTLPFPVEMNALVDGMVGFLGAPMSAESMAALERADPGQIAGRVLR